MCKVIVSIGILAVFILTATCIISLDETNDFVKRSCRCYPCYESILLCIIIAKIVKYKIII